MRRSLAVTIRSTTEHDWREVKQLRLEMLRDFPIAYGETLEHAERQTDQEWRMRARRGQGPRSSSFVAIDEATMRWVGTMGGYVPVTPGADAMLVGVYVAPEFRGAERGITDRLLDEVESWAREFGDTLSLHVHEENPRAIRFYERRGFVDTGRRLEYELEPYGQELEMRKHL